jgi:leader peptidase (prepilin peptidase) / N-methyltransferase
MGHSPMLYHIFDPAVWAAVPFGFWSAMFFALGCIVGSFLNVCIHRLPLGQSIVSPPSHCPHCKYEIPWYLNVPLVTWLYLRGKCRNCGAPIAMRYFLVELLTGVLFLACWLRFGRQSLALALVYSVFLSGLIVATFIDFEHFIIPDEVTFGGMLAGFLCSFFVPGLHGNASLTEGLKQSLLGMGLGALIIYVILRLGKLFFGRERLRLHPGDKVVFGETSLHVAEKEIPYEDVFYRDSDVIVLHASTLELVDRCYRDVRVRLTREKLEIGEEVLDPEEVPHLEAVSAEVVLPREAMGLGDVKFMAAIGAFLGWQAVLFALVVSSFIGSLVGLTLVVLRKRALSSRLPYGPYIAVAAALWIFAGPEVVAWYRQLIAGMAGAR